MRLVYLLLFLPCLLAGQTSDDFEDGDLLNPEWTGDTQDFEVSNGRLRLMADGAGESELRVDLGLDPSARQELTVEFLVDMQFSPSGSNYCAIRLQREYSGGPSPQFDFLEIRFGGESGDQDALTGRFFELDVDLTTGRGTDGALGSEPAIARVQLRKTVEGLWTVAADYSGGRNFVDEFTLDVPGFLPEEFVLFCDYTATRADRFSFDDLNVESVIPPDTFPPAVENSLVIDATTARIVFDEPVEPQSSSAYQTDLVDNDVVDVAFPSGQSDVVDLTFSNPLPIDQLFDVTITGLTDLAGNTAEPITIRLRYRPTGTPAEAGVIITELMPDPNPVVSLPDAEYIELFNPSDRLFAQLDGIGVASGNSEDRLNQNYLLGPGEHVVVARPSDAASFLALGVEVITLDFPALTNSGDDVSLTFASQTLQRLDYTTAWYNDPDRDEGGYSLEYTGNGPTDCGGSWRASLDDDGGTPGRANSVEGQPADQSPPVVTGSSVDMDGITITFDEPTLTEFTLTTGPEITSVTANEDGTEFRLGFDEELQPGERYVLRVDTPEDCAGNAGQEVLLTLGIPGEPQPGDVIINEILFNPVSGGSDFVEIYNTTDQFFQLEGWELVNAQGTSSTAARTITTSRLLGPREYLVFTPDAVDLPIRFAEVDPALVAEQSLPSLPNDAGNITLRAFGTVLDAFDYNEDFHTRLLDDEDGVSLERRRFSGPTQDRNNWFSAASAVGFGTPTKPNSQFVPEGVSLPAGQSFSLANPTFSPDGDAFEDQLEIVYNLDGTISNPAVRIRIFDAQGRPVRVLRDVELLGTVGSITWDGSTDDGSRARAGIHVINIELFAEGRMTETERLVAVVAGTR